MFYILDAQNNVTASCDQLPDVKDIAARGEKILEDQAVLPAGKAMVQDGKIVERPAPALTQEQLDRQKVYDRMFANAAAELAAEGAITSPDLVNYQDIATKEKTNVSAQ